MLTLADLVLRNRMLRIECFMSCSMNVRMHIACKIVRRPIWNICRHVGNAGMMYNIHVKIQSCPKIVIRHSPKKGENEVRQVPAESAS